MNSFPLEVFPEPISAYIKNCNTTLGLDSEIMSATALSMLATLIGNRYWLQVKNGWKERACLWIVTIAPSGIGKTPAQKKILKPFYDIDHKMFKQFEKENRDYEQNIEGRQRPVSRQLFVSDITPEALLSKLAFNKSGLLYIKD